MCNRVISSDEERFNFDGSDDCRHYWWELRKKRKTYFSWHSGCSGVMVWSALSLEGKKALCVIAGTLNKEVYTELLQDYMLSFTSGKHGTRKNDFNFMQDNVSVHTAFHCQKWFKENKMKVLP